MAIWSVNAKLYLDADLTRAEMKAFLQNAGMNDILDLVTDMTLTHKDVEKVIKHRGT